MAILAYGMCLMVYLALIAVSIVCWAPLFLVPSKRRLALQWSLAIVASLPGILAFQFVTGLLIVVLSLVVRTFCAVFHPHPPDWVQPVVSIPVVLIILILFTVASFWGCYTGGRIGWEIGGGKPFKTAISEQKIVRLALSWFRKDRV
jgi:hypothetical protein